MHEVACQDPSSPTIRRPRREILIARLVDTYGTPSIASDIVYALIYTLV